MEPHYVSHPVDEIEPTMDESEVMQRAALYFTRIFGWINDGRTAGQRGVRMHVVLMVLYSHLGRPEGGYYTCANVGAAYGLTRAAVNKVVQEFRDQFGLTTEIKNRAMRGEQNRTICQRSQKRALKKTQIRKQSSAEAGAAASAASSWTRYGGRMSVLSAKLARLSSMQL